MLTKIVVVSTLSSLISNYVGFFPRLDKYGGGVCVYVRAHVMYCFNIKLVYFEKGFYFLCFSFCNFLFCSYQNISLYF